MLAKRIIPCLDVRDGKVTKGIKFLANVDVGDPVAMASTTTSRAPTRSFSTTSPHPTSGAASCSKWSARSRRTFSFRSASAAVCAPSRTCARCCWRARKRCRSIPGRCAIRKSSRRAARRSAAQCIVLSMQVKFTGKRAEIPSGYEVVIDGGRTTYRPRCDRVVARRRAARRGRVVINSIDRDGTKEGYDLEITRAISEAVSIPVIASGGAGEPSHLRDAFTRGAAMRDRRIHRALRRISDSRFEAVSAQLRRRSSRCR